MGQKFVSILPHKTNNLDADLIAKKTASFDIGTFKVETNLSERVISNKYLTKDVVSYTLENIEENLILPPYVDSTSYVKLNLSKSDPTNYALYGSFKIKIQTAIDNIIASYPASLIITNKKNGVNINNITNVTYNPFNDTTTFNIGCANIINPLSLNYIKSVQSVSDNRNLLNIYSDYELLVNDKNYIILELIGAENKNDKLTLKVQGKPFENGVSSIGFYIKPNSNYFNLFLSNLDSLEQYLLQEQIYFDDYLITDVGTQVQYRLQFTWPKADLFNLDISSNLYNAFYSELINYANKIDETYSNLIYRQYTPKSIYNATEDSIEESNIDDLIQVYGESFDEIYKRIKNAKFLHSVSFNDFDNQTPNLYLSQLLKILGWNFDSQSLDVSVLKTLVLTSNWIWKTKGTRAAINFILTFLGIPKELIQFAEYVYVAKEPINIEKFNFYLSLLGSSISLSDFPVDDSGYPIYPEESEDFYLQMNGEQDNGQAFLNLFYNLMPDFSGSTATYFREINTYSKIFEQEFIYSSSTLDYDIVRQQTLTSDICYTSTGQTISDPIPAVVLDECGCPIEVDDFSLEICSSPIDLYGSCLDFFLDVWLNCDFDLSGNPIATINITPYNNLGSVTYVGTQPSSVLSNNEVFSVYGIDSNGCTSEVYSGTVICALNVCDNTTITGGIEYVCNTNELGQQTGTATIENILISGGTAPYVTNISIGDVVEHGQMVELIITDANGCTSQSIISVIDCPADEEFVCENINLTLAYEAVFINLDCQEGFDNCAVAETQAKLNYEVYNLPAGVNVQNVEYTVDAPPFLVGGPVTTIKTTPIGSTTYYVDFAPDPPQMVITTFSITVTLSNGCVYNTSYISEFEYGILGYSFSENFILTT